MFSRLVFTLTAAATVSVHALFPVCYFTYETDVRLQACPLNLAGRCVCHEADENPGVVLDSLDGPIVSITGVPTTHEVFLYKVENFRARDRFLERHDGIQRPDGKMVISREIKKAKSAVVLEKMDDNACCVYEEEDFKGARDCTTEDADVGPGFSAVAGKNVQCNFSRRGINFWKALRGFDFILKGWKTPTKGTEPSTIESVQIQNQ